MSSPVVGIVGGGQLARMTAQAAVSLGVEVRVLARDPRDPACSAAARFEIGDPDDLAALLRFSAGCDVVTFDHEQVDPGHVAALEASGHQVRPGSATLRFSDKAHQRGALGALGFPVPAFALATTLAEIEAFASVHGWPVVAKLAVGGYDGRGVFVLDGPASAALLLGEQAARRLVLEPLLDIDREVAVVLARRPTGETAVYPLVETLQADGICVETIAPAAVEPRVAAEAAELASSIAELIGATGILAIELFVTSAGLVVNELAPRPHNSGHWTIDGAATSQFENHLRAVLDWPLGDTGLLAPAVAMANVLGDLDNGDPADRLPSALGVGGASIHLYGKALQRGRKLGHVTSRGADRQTALDQARASASALGGARAATPIGGPVS